MGRRASAIGPKSRCLRSPQEKPQIALTTQISLDHTPLSLCCHAAIASFKDTWIPGFEKFYPVI